MFNAVDMEEMEALYGKLGHNRVPTDMDKLVFKNYLEGWEDPSTVKNDVQFAKFRNKYMGLNLSDYILESRAYSTKRTGDT